MEILYESEHRRLTLRFASAAAAAEFLVSVEANGGFLVQLPTALRLHDPVEVLLEANGPSATLPARVAQVFDKGFGSFGTAFLVDDTTAARGAFELETESGATPEARPGDEAPPLGEDATDDTESPTELSFDEAPEAADEREAGEMMGTSPIHRIREMNPSQRAMLAQKAGRTERQILLRDKSSMVLENLLNNPRIDSEEVLRIARSSRTVARTLQRIANDSRWSANQEILAAIARHPQTPSTVVTRLLPSLRIPDLRTMAKMSSGLRETIRKAALREYMRRTGQRI